MGTVASLNADLIECCERLVECVSQLRELAILKDEKAIYKLGAAIAEINEVRTSLYRLHPDLKPRLWDEPPSADDYAAWFEQAKQIAEEYCRAGNLAQAISTFETFLFIGPTESAAFLARQEIVRLRRQMSSPDKGA